MRSLTDAIVAASSIEDWDKINKKISAHYSKVSVLGNLTSQAVNQAAIERQHEAKLVVTGL
ncbi:MAG: hypothetical protein ACRCXC_13420 [Legionella sp.]